MNARSRRLWSGAALSALVAGSLALADAPRGPVKVTVNGRSVHSAMVTRDPKTLIRWAARDNDRTTLYAAELKIVVP